MAGLLSAAKGNSRPSAASLAAGGRERGCRLIHGLFHHVQCTPHHCNGRRRRRPLRHKQMSVPGVGSVAMALMQSIQLSLPVPASNDLLSKLIERNQ
jgi:hypothetical protein